MERQVFARPGVSALEECLGQPQLQHGRVEVLVAQHYHGLKAAGRKQLGQRGTLEQQGNGASLQPGLAKLEGPPVPVTQTGGVLTGWILSGRFDIRGLQSQHPYIVADAVLGLHADGCCVYNTHHSHIEELGDAQHCQLGYFVRLARPPRAVRGADAGLR